MIWIILAVVYLAIGLLGGALLHTLSKGLGGEGLGLDELVWGVLLWPVPVVRYLVARWRR